MADPLDLRAELLRREIQQRLAGLPALPPSGLPQPTPLTAPAPPGAVTRPGPVMRAPTARERVLDDPLGGTLGAPTTPPLFEIAPDIKAGDWRRVLSRLVGGTPVPGQAAPAEGEFLARTKSIGDLLTQLPGGNPADPFNVDVGPALASGPVVVDVVKTVFPRLDKYGKPAGHLTSATILKRLEATPDLAPEARAALTQAAEQVGTRRVAPDELHAIVQGVPYTPPRVIRKVKPIAEGAKQIPGAPLGVTNAAEARALRENYIKGMTLGIPGRDWYHTAGESILFHANDDPARARLAAGDLAITSPAASVASNAGFGIKGYNQATAGVPVAAGRFPTAMGKSIEELHAGGEGTTGLKRVPFAENLARGGGFQDVAPDAPTRAVHDIWDAEGHGYVDPSGGPLRTGFGPAQHRFMDTQQDKIIATSNQRAVGGFRNWDDLRTQAAQWTGQQIRAGVLDPKDAAQSYADHFAKLYAQGSREATPGPTTGHMPELLTPGMEPWRQLHHEIMLRPESGIYDEQLRDQIAAGYGALVGRAFEGPGVYKGRTSPGVQTQALTGSMAAPGGLPGARVPDEGSRLLMDAAEATYALGMGQDAYAWNKLLPAGSGAAKTGWDVLLPGGTITDEQMAEVLRRLGGRQDVIPVPTPGGVRFGYPPSDLTDPSRQVALPFLRDMDPQLKDTIKAIGGKVEESGAFRGGYGENPWDLQVVGQGYLDKIRAIGGAKAFDVAQPAIFEKIRKANELFRRESGGRVTMSQMLDEVRAAAAGGGFADLERLAKKYGLPVTVLVAGLGALAESAPSDQAVPEA